MFQRHFVVVIILFKLKHVQSSSRVLKLISLNQANFTLVCSRISREFLQVNRGLKLSLLKKAVFCLGELKKIILSLQ